MRLYRALLTHNDCYLRGRTIRPRGVMVHSTGANNPWLRRYLAPDDGRLGTPSPRHWNQGGVGACVHAMIGKAADGSVAVYQTKRGAVELLVPAPRIEILKPSPG